jgi:hypothetical protein
MNEDNYFQYVKDEDTTISSAYNVDGNLAMTRDTEGVLWGVFGQTDASDTGSAAPYPSKLTVWKGTNPYDIVPQYNAALNFLIGPAGESYNQTPYPGGIRSRGVIWPIGLYIDDEGKWWCYLHNETGWRTGNSSGYRATGPSVDSEGEPDFRFLGLMTSVDQGKTWDFVKWVISAYEPAYTALYQPDGLTRGDAQPGPDFVLGAGDACIFVNDNDGYIYLFYCKHLYRKNQIWLGQVFAARASRETPGEFKKLYCGSWEEPGQGGRETPLRPEAGLIPTVAYSDYLKKFVLFCYNPDVWSLRDTDPTMSAQYSISNDLINWSPFVLIEAPHTKQAAEPYWSIYSTADTGNLKFIGKEFYLFHNMWGNAVKRMTLTTGASGG